MVDVIRYLLFFFIIVFFSCTPEYRYYSIVNSTSHEVVIKGFRRETILNLEADVINIKPYSEQIIKRLDGEDHDNRNFFSIDLVDSANIIFDSEKILTVTCEKYADFNCYPLVSGLHLNFSITEEDYNSAVPITE